MKLEPTIGFPPKGVAGLYWLGQAGFWIDTGVHRILIDPYLSDSLARKYAGTAYPHLRMMPPPVTVAELPRPDLVLVTHAHTDHMDPDTLMPLRDRFPDLTFVVPAAELETARERIGVSAELWPALAGDRFSPLDGLEIEVFPAAHEIRERDADGRDRYLGYGIKATGLKLYHSGDSVPFDLLDGLVQSFAPDVALLPVNGRDAKRRAANIPGNFTLEEAAHLARNCAFLVPHHFGMFAFNTAETADIDTLAARTSRPKVLRPEAGSFLRILP
ncbi:MBL fold metallo-hydrolase [Litoreibacter albidus]|uniref:L-ascorbate metabolism protein UlaG, beta-lactamase superfamily n=1 Tax=Litoreibacter albidus TaxID=670155 RepID=A0A1H3CMI5_9RHOB|nr:MBL fold metallo-hydrolase [Litoreibacter albidus]SDX54649.1 L-ascorbate metabolism protein UlaG, beta-lactamase superfamily [Litoreibacter albidus]